MKNSERFSKHWDIDREQDPSNYQFYEDVGEFLNSYEEFDEDECEYIARKLDACCASSEATMEVVKNIIDCIPVNTGI
jgi:hypothetical protein